MFVELKFRCGCGKIGIVECEIEERRGESGCGCCSGPGTGEWHLVLPCKPLPEGWPNRYWCGECPDEEV